MEYRKHWKRFQQGAKYLDNLFNYFNRVSLNKYHCMEGVDYPVPGLPPSPLASHGPPDTQQTTSPLEIRHVSRQQTVWCSMDGESEACSLVPHRRPLFHL